MFQHASAELQRHTSVNALFKFGRGFFYIAIELFNVDIMPVFDIFLEEFLTMLLLLPVVVHLIEFIFF
jgi:hypothetical protein